MKRKFLSLITALLFTSFFTACISTKNTAYVEGADDFTAYPLTINLSGKSIKWKNYELAMDSIKKDISQKTIAGVGKKSGILKQEGKFSKDGNFLYKTSIFNRIDGWVEEDEKSTTNFYDYIYTIESGKNGTVFYISQEEDNTMIQDSQILPLVFTKIITYKNSSGKTYDLWMNTSCGTKVSVYGEIYAVIDNYDQSIRLNPSFSKSLTEEEEDLLASLMLEFYNYDTSFYSADISATSSSSIL